MFPGNTNVLRPTWQRGSDGLAPWPHPWQSGMHAVQLMLLGGNIASRSNEEQNTASCTLGHICNTTPTIHMYSVSRSANTVNLSDDQLYVKAILTARRGSGPSLMPHLVAENRNPCELRMKKKNENISRCFGKGR